MDISRKTDYALRMLSLLVAREGEPLSVRIAAEQVDVPYSFARSIQHALTQAGIIASVRGVHGGMRLEMDPAEVTMLDVMRAVEGELSLNACTAPGGDCARMGVCCFHPLWLGAERLLESYFRSVTLADVVLWKRFPAVDPSFSDPAAFCSYADCSSLRTHGAAS